MRTETLAVVFTDIKGYTAATAKQSHQEQAHMLRRIDRLVAPVVRAFSGRVIKSIGDAYMIVFKSPTEAVRCACAIQDRLYQHNTNRRADQGLHIRIAINVGEVRVHRGDVFGEPVNIAARVESVTPADEVYLSQAVYLTMNRSNIPAERVGDYELKGINEPVAVYRVRPFSDQEEESGEEEDSQRAAGLPYGGTDLEHWRTVRWIRRAYVALWGVAIAGLIGAGYIRYRPRSDFGEVVADMKTAVEEGRAMEALALAGDIPPHATREFTRSRRYRRQAVRLLINSDQAADHDTARLEIDRLLEVDSRDSEALMLRGLLQLRDTPIGAIDSLEAALALDPSYADQTEFVDAVVDCYRDAAARKTADSLVTDHLKHRAIRPLKRALALDVGDRLAKNAIAYRLKKLGAGDGVDWVELAIADLQSTNCKTRKVAIATLVRLRDQRAVGPLIKLANAKICGSSPARKAADAILKQ